MFGASIVIVVIIAITVHNFLLLLKTTECTGNIILHRGNRGKERERDKALTESEALALGCQALVLAVYCGFISSLTTVVAAPPVTGPPTHHWGEDDLDAVHAGRQVGPWIRQSRAAVREEELNAHKREIQLLHLHTPFVRALREQRFITVEVCMRVNVSVCVDQRLDSGTLQLVEGCVTAKTLQRRREAS